MKEKSIFHNAEIIKPGKKIAANFLDMFLAFLLCLGFFAISDAIFNNTSFISKKRDSANEIAHEMQLLAINSGVAKENSEGTLISQNEIVSLYIKGATFEALSKNNIEGIESTYKEVTKVNESNDGLFLYYTKFKIENKTDYSNVSQQNCGLTYYLDKLKSNSSKDYFEGESYPYLNKDSAIAIDEYLRNSNYTKGKTIYEKLDSSYRLLLTEGVNDLQNNYNGYINLNTKYQNEISSMYFTKDMELLVSYLLSLFIIYILMPIIFKNGKTLAFKALSLVSTSKDGTTIAWYQYLLKYIIMFLESFFLMGITAVIFYGSSAIGWIGRNYILNLSLLTLSIYSVLIWFVSETLTFAFRNTHQNLSELISSCVTRDEKNFDVKVKEIKTNER